MSPNYGQSEQNYGLGHVFENFYSEFSGESCGKAETSELL